MNDVDLQQKVEDLRRQLNGGNYVQSGRIDSTGTTGGNSEPDNTSVNRQERRTSENIRTTDSRTTRGTTVDSTGTRSPGRPKRVAKTVLTGVGQTTDGDEQDHSSVSSARHDDKGTATGRRLIRDESEPPTRTEHPNVTNIFTAPTRRGPGRPPKVKEDGNATTSVVETKPVRAETVSDKVTDRVAKRFQWFGQASTITAQEVNSLLEPLADSLISYGGYIDEYARIKMNDMSLIFFGDLSINEATVLARLILRLGRSNPQVATGVRTLVNGNDYVSAIFILWPRISKLVSAMRPDGVMPVPVRQVQARVKQPGLFVRAELPTRYKKEKELD